MESKGIFVLDGGDIIVVDQEKFLLVREVIKHYTPRWQKEAKEAESKRQLMSIGKAVSSMLGKLSVEHELNPSGLAVLPMSVLSAPVPAANPASAPDAPATPAPDEEKQSVTPPGQSSMFPPTRREN